MQIYQKKPTVNGKQIFIGLIALIVGTLFYFFDRPPEDVYFLSRLGRHFSQYGAGPLLLGHLGASLPAFIHVFAFSLITAGILAGRIRMAAAVCLSWISIDLLFELGQKYPAAAGRLVPDWFDGIPFLENTRGYFRHGTYDVSDIIATAVGGGMAFLVIVMTMHKQKRKQKI